MINCPKNDADKLASDRVAYEHMEWCLGRMVYPTYILETKERMNKIAGRWPAGTFKTF